MMINVKEGDKVKLTFLCGTVINTDEHGVSKGLKVGDMGVVHSVKHIKNFFNDGKGYHQIWIKWENGLRFPLIQEQDGYEIIKRDG